MITVACRANIRLRDSRRNEHAPKKGNEEDVVGMMLGWLRSQDFPTLSGSWIPTASPEEHLLRRYLDGGTINLCRKASPTPHSVASKQQAII